MEFPKDEFLNRVKAELEGLGYVNKTGTTWYETPNKERPGLSLEFVVKEGGVEPRAHISFRTDEKGLTGEQLRLVLRVTPTRPVVQIHGIRALTHKGETMPRLMGFDERWEATISALFPAVVVV